MIAQRIADETLSTSIDNNTPTTIDGHLIMLIDVKHQRGGISFYLVNYHCRGDDSELLNCVNPSRFQTSLIKTTFVLLEDKQKGSCVFWRKVMILLHFGDKMRRTRT
ncbi:hypothetical protein F2Q69_00029107 [Brassica cretica]|uniref:Uncharacterized protein n=1 Tax=Brassica cretica TaxID=69181 RepID=A0A8S9S9I1_BRACR|nr:hypothetical protein F2Q69_00029107 [Brassica cretica]